MYLFVVVQLVDLAVHWLDPMSSWSRRAADCRSQSEWRGPARHKALQRLRRTAAPWHWTAGNDASDLARRFGETQRSPRPNSSIAVSDQVSGSSTIRVSDLAKWLRPRAGRAETSMRRLASALGRSPSVVHEELRRLVACGLISVARGPRGTGRPPSIEHNRTIATDFGICGGAAPPSRRASQNPRRVDCFFTQY